MQRDEVRALEQLVERHASAARGVDHLHPEPLGASRHRRADPPHPHDAERGTAQLLAEQEVGLPAPASAAHRPLGLRQPPGRAQHQRPRQVSRGLREHSRRVADGHPALAGGRQVHVVHPHRVVGHRREPWARVEQRGVHPLRELGEQAIGFARMLDQPLGPGRRGLGPHVQLVHGGQPLESSPRQLARHKAAGHRSARYLRRGQPCLNKRWRFAARQAG